MDEIFISKRGSVLAASAINESLIPEVLGDAVLAITSAKPRIADDEETVPDAEKPSIILRIIRNRGIQLAPVSLFFGVAIGVYMPVFTELVKDRVCQVALNYSSDICAHISGSDSKESIAVRSVTADYLLYCNIISSIPCIIFSLFMGSWSDRYGRKIPMLSPFVGMILASAVLMICANMTLHPVYLLPAPAIASVFGGWVITMMAIFSYIGDYTTEKTRSLVIAFVMSFMGIGMSVGQLVGSSLLKHFGFPAPVYAYAGFHCLSLIYILIVVKDHEDFVKKAHEEKTTSRACSLFQLYSIRSNWHTLRQKREHNGRFLIILLLLSYTAASMCIENESTILQLFVEFKPLSWSVSQYAGFASLQGIVSCVVITISIPIFKKVLHMRDTIIGIFCGLSGVACAFGYSISVKTWMIYMSLCFGVLRSLTFICIQSTLMGLVPRDETGKVMSMVASIQSISMATSALIFVKLYSATAGLWPGLVFAVESFVLVFPVATFCFIDIALRNPH